MAFHAAHLQLWLGLFVIAGVLYVRPPSVQTPGVVSSWTPESLHPVPNPFPPPNYPPQPRTDTTPRQPPS